MSTAQLQTNCAIVELAESLATAGVLDEDWESTVLFIPKRGRLHCSALAFLCAWGRQQRRLGRELLIRGPEATLARLMRLDLHEHLGLAYRKDARLTNVNPFVPLRLISNEQDMTPA